MFLTSPLSAVLMPKNWRKSFIQYKLYCFDEEINTENRKEKNNVTCTISGGYI